MEATPLFGQESLNSNSESLDETDEVLGDERRKELAVELGGIVNPLAGDNNFSATDTDDEDEE